MSAAAAAIEPRPMMTSTLSSQPDEPACEKKWGRSTVLALAVHRCTACNGSGHIFGKNMRVRVCNCVLRAVFRICWEKFITCITQERHLSRVSVEPHRGRSRPSSWGRKDEEFIADFILVTRRSLEPAEYQIFKMHFLLGLDWRAVALKTGINRGNFFHTVYRIEQKLGRVFHELEPYALFPVDEYFRAPSVQTHAFEGSRQLRNGTPVHPPLAKP